MPDFARMIDELQYSIIVLIAGIHWSLQEALLMAGYTVKLVNIWLIENAFMPIIAQTNNSLGLAVSIVFVVALLVLGITYLLAAFIRLDVVSPRSAIMWYIAGVLFFTIGPNFYQGMNTFRLNISQVMYLSVLQGLDANAGDFSSLAQVNSNDLDLGPLCDQFDVYLPGATGPGPIDGLDIAMAYLRGHAQDVMGYPQPVYSPGCGIYLQNPNPSTWAGAGGTSVVPMDWNMEGNYFDHNSSPITWDDVEDTVRDHAVSMAGSSQQRALTAWPLLLFGLVEQIVHLLTRAAGVSVQALAEDPFQPGKFYAYLDGIIEQGAGFYQSSDWSEHWERLSVVFPNYIKRVPHERFWIENELLSVVIAQTKNVCGTNQLLCVDPDREGTIYVGEWTEGLFRSTDGGSTWQDISHTLPFKRERASVLNVIRADEHEAGVLYAGFIHEGLWRSRDYGDTWQKLFPTDDAIFNATSVAVGGTDGKLIVVVSEPLYWSLCESAVYVSRDAGESWEDIYDKRLGAIRWKSVTLEPNTNKIYAASCGNSAFHITLD